jgi:N-acetylglucosamine kinase-like BadF-type ATPase
MKYIIGIDGGGTKTVCAVADIEGTILKETTGRPSNFLVSGTEKVVENLFKLIEGGLFELNADFPNVKQIVVGTAGAGRKQHAELLESVLKRYAEKERIHLNSVKVVSDALIALEGAFPGKPGCVLICGTGSILYCRDDKSNIHRVGGLGRLIGDEGSGFSIGRKGLNAASKEFDGRGESTILTKILNDEFSINSSDELINKIYSNEFEISAFARSVLEGAKNMDKVSAKILDEEAAEVILHIKSALKKLSLKKIELVFAGSLIDNENVYSDLIRRKIKETFPDVEIVKPAKPPVAGAILLAKKIIDEKN